MGSTAASTELARRVRELRHKTGKSRKWIAEAADIDITHLTRIESGTGNPTLHKLIQLAVALEVDPSELVSGLGADDVPQENRPHGYSEHHLYRRRPRRATDDVEG
ncbi:helix-turn-helix domain-containing protein [Microbacterium album]|uniref:HTH cro/C1-type domain-containing protein n=1 Tax=Microbacterium album TaxID=2053191 RepID=A0A917IF33_9MICO|nr:helix-turn-helix transcriptional regulator [Microbacterium album]GGH40176.1 hypothetical protein GCM10010921_11910 [Microbacterium album]